MAEPTSDQLFGKYRLLGVMSAGGMAELFLALQAGLEGFSKVVALKRVLPHLAQSEDFVQMFMDEARLAARLDHPNIVRVYDFGETNGQYFMAMEYLPGEDLSNILFRSRKSRQGVPFEIAAAVVQAAAEGLHFAHELTAQDGTPLGLVHRDANPTNILVTYQGAVKVVDFGIAKALGNISQTQFGQIKGKAAYLAPEQARGDLQLDRRTDIFCLGIVLWEALTGERLFSRDNDMASAQASLTYNPPPPSQLRAHVPPQLDAITMKALAKNPEQRFQTAGEMADALEVYFRNGAVKPSAKEISAWVEGLFGAVRANAKRAIAQGRKLDVSIPQVMKTVPPEVLESLATPMGRMALDQRPTEEVAIPQAALTTPSSGPVATSSLRRGARPQTITEPSSGPPMDPQTADPGAQEKSPLGRRLALAGALVALAVGLLVGGNQLAGALGGEKRPERAPASRAASLELDSTPPGAFIFIGGEPTGRFTPTRLSQLTGDSVTVRLELAGYEPARETVPLAPGQPVKRSYVLKPQAAEVAVRLAQGAELFVDGERTATERPLVLAPGKHVFKVKVEGQPDLTRTLDVRPGEQKTVELP